MTYLRNWEGVGFFSFVLDVYSRRCVGWQLAGNMRTDLVLDALRMALGTRRHGADLQLIHHSDSEYVLAGHFGWSDPHSDRRERWIRSGREDAGRWAPSGGLNRTLIDPVGCPSLDLSAMPGRPAFHGSRP